MATTTTRTAAAMGADDEVPPWRASDCEGCILNVAGRAVCCMQQMHERGFRMADLLRVKVPRPVTWVPRSRRGP